MSDMPSGDHNRNRTPAVDGASVTLRGSVEQIISSLGKQGSDVVQVVIEDGEPLYREIRIRNPFQDASGNVITFQLDSEIEITMRVRARK
jgi:hypothetical protein